jgi:hypothetical protein
MMTKEDVGFPRRGSKLPLWGKVVFFRILRKKKKVGAPGHEGIPLKL